MNLYDEWIARQGNLFICLIYFAEYIHTSNTIIKQETLSLTLYELVNNDFRRCVSRLILDQRM
jgi:hypothetical protein